MCGPPCIPRHWCIVEMKLVLEETGKIVKSCHILSNNGLLQCPLFYIKEKDKMYVIVSAKERRKERYKSKRETV